MALPHLSIGTEIDSQKQDIIFVPHKSLLKVVLILILRAPEIFLVFRYFNFSFKYHGALSWSILCYAPLQLVQFSYSMPI